jgi:hypothetical protein
VQAVQHTAKEIVDRSTITGFNFCVPAVALPQEPTSLTSLRLTIVQFRAISSLFRYGQNDDFARNFHDV